VQAYSTQKIKIAALVCLQDVLRKQPAIATSVVGLGLRHRGQSARNLGRLYEEVEPTVRYVQLDQIASAHSRQRAAAHPGMEAAPLDRVLFSDLEALAGDGSLPGAQRAP